MEFAILFRLFFLLILQIIGGGKICLTDKVATQIPDWRDAHINKSFVATDQRGCPLPSLTSTLSIGSKGPLLLQDMNFLNNIAHFSRERIPERVVHGKGAGAFGYFEVTHDITHLTKAVVFSKIGKKTPVTARFSQSIGERGTPDTFRDNRGMSLKFQTEDGIWDLTHLNTQSFFIKDPILFPSLVHAIKRNPQTGVKDQNMFWDFLSLREESTLTVLLLMSDEGLPDGYRHMAAFAVNTFKMVNSAGKAVYVKFTWTPDQGEKHLNTTMGNSIAGMDADYATRDLYDAIANKNFPSWTMWIQVMTFKEAEEYKWDPFDASKVWFKKDFPLRPVGKLFLTHNPVNYHAHVEQLAFSPGNLIPGIEVSPDLLLQGRFFSYSDTARYRLGANFNQLPINFPANAINFHPYVRDGEGSAGENGASSPNYYPNSFNGPFIDEVYARQSVFSQSAGDVERDDTENDPFSQAVIYWKLFSEGEKTRIAENIVTFMKGVTNEVVKARAIGNFAKVSKELLDLVNAGLKLASDV